MKNKVFKAVKITLGVLAVLAVAGTVAISGVVADKIIHQNDGKDTHDNSLKQLEVWGYDEEAFEKRYQGREISAVATDGNKVPASFFDGEKDECVIIVHGAGGDRVSAYPLAEAYIERGYDVIAIDQRGCGKNESDEVTFGIREKADVSAVVKFAKEELDEEKVIVHGQSMGAQTVMLYAADVKAGASDAADAVICDSPVPGMELILKEMFGDGDTKSFTANFLVGGSKLFSKLFFGLDFEEGDTIAKAAEDELPTLVICSEKDEVCLPDQVKEMYDNISSDKKQFASFDSAHIEGIIDEPEAYMDCVEGFFDEIGL